MKTKLSLIFIFLAAMNVAGKLYAQEMMTPSALPSASSMGLVSAVNHTTGTVNVSVPLLDFESNGIHVPIALYYNTSGIRVEDRPTEMGYGWRLSAGGRITRVVKRRPDDISLTNQPWWADSLEAARGYFKNYDDDRYNDYAEIDGESDLFYYEIPGKSGMFVLDGQNKPHTIPYQSDVTIEIIGGTHFVIKDNAGNVYTFGNDEASRENSTVTYKNENLKKRYEYSVQKPIDWPYQWDWPIVENDQFPRPVNWKAEWPWPVMRYHTRPWNWPSHWPWPVDSENIMMIVSQQDTLSYVSSWHLNSIKSYSGNTVTFNYAVGVIEDITSYTYLDTYAKVDVINNMWEKTSKTYPVTTTTDTKVLSSIAGGETTIAFAKGGTVDNRLAGITYSINGSRIKSYSFSYSSVNNRRFLTEITEGPSTGTSRKYCSFEYNSVRLPADLNSNSYDSWGYYNGSSNNTYTTAPIEANYMGSGISAKPGINRLTPSLTHTKAGILTAIVHNTGGKTTYEYGLNKHDLQDIGGLRVERINHIDNNNSTSSIRYEYGKSVLGGIGQMPYHTSYADNGTLFPLVTSSSKPLNALSFVSGANIIYGEITEIASDGSKTVYEYSTPDSGTQYRNSGFLLRHYDKIIDDIGEGDWDALTEGKYDIPLTSRFWRHGLLLNMKRIDSNNNISEEVIYNYKHDHQKLTIIKGYVPWVTSSFIEKLYFLLEYQWESMPVLLASTEMKYFGRETSKVTTRYVYDDVRVLPTSVTQTDAEGNSIRTTHRYAHDLTHSPTNVNFPTKTLVNNGILAPVETVTYKNYEVVSAELTEYGFVPLEANSTAVMPVRKYYMPLQAPVSGITEANYSGTTTLGRDPRYRLAETYGYDGQGNVLSTTTPEGQKSAVVYQKDQTGKNTNLVIAEVSNAVHTIGAAGRTNQVFHTSFETTGEGTASTKAKTGRQVKSGTYMIGLADFIPGTYVLSYWKSTNSGTSWVKTTEIVNITTTVTSKTIGGSFLIDEVRLIPADARIKTYTYSPGVGVISESDHNGNTVYWEYDNFGRITRILDNDRQVLESYEYNIKN